MVCLVPALVSLVHALSQASNSSLGIRTVEWMRDNGARGLVNQVESIYYSLNAPAKGGPGLRTLPSLAGVRLNSPTAHRHAVRHYYRPPRIRPVLPPRSPGRVCGGRRSHTEVPDPRF